MMRRRALLETLVIVLVGILVTFLVRAHNAPRSVDVVAGSSLIANIIHDVADDSLQTRTLIPPGVCPSHYDVRTSDIETLANSRALLIHNFQQNYQNVVGAIEAAENPDLVITVLNVTGNWMLPAIHAEAVGKIAQALGEIYPENAAYYQGNATERVQTILTYGEDVKSRLQDAGVDGVKVICAAIQEGFVRWAGFSITATFGRPEELSPGDVEQLITQARDAGVALIIDNLQSGATTLGASIEQDIDAITVTISNFPGGLQNTGTWEKAIDKNVDLLLEALNAWEEQYG
jgi:ABC-type Zn uptake system ZnuABC Zn-binding protein ZnuA